MIDTEQEWTPTAITGRESILVFYCIKCPKPNRIKPIKELMIRFYVVERIRFSPSRA